MSLKSRKSSLNVLFVCLGNICRSPAAQGVLSHLASQNYPRLELHVESCALGSWNLGAPADARMRQAAEKRGIALTTRSKPFEPAFFERFDYILAADHSVLEELQKRARHPKDKAKLFLITEFSAHYKREEVKDPYHGGEDGFEHALDIITDACEGLLKHLGGEDGRGKEEGGTKGKDRTS